MTDTPNTMPDLIELHPGHTDHTHLISDDEFTDCFGKAEPFPTLGPNYFAARKIAERFMADFEAEHFEPMIGKFVNDFEDQIRSALAERLLTDTESNLHQEIWRRVDHTVNALLSGEPWALKHYVTDQRYGDGEKIRRAVADLIPSDLQDARVTNLKEEIEWLRSRVRTLEGRYR